MPGKAWPSCARSRTCARTGGERRPRLVVRPEPPAHAPRAAPLRTARGVPSQSWTTRCRKMASSSSSTSPRPSPGRAIPEARATRSSRPPPSSGGGGRRSRRFRLATRNRQASLVLGLSVLPYCVRAGGSVRWPPAPPTLPPLPPFPPCRKHFSLRRQESSCGRPRPRRRGGTLSAAGGGAALAWAGGVGRSSSSWSRTCGPPGGGGGRPARGGAEVLDVSTGTCAASAGPKARSTPRGWSCQATVNQVRADHRPRCGRCC